MGALTQISVTERASYRTCKRQWLWSVSGQDPEPQKILSWSWLGTALHAGLQSYYAHERAEVPMLLSFGTSCRHAALDLSLHFPPAVIQEDIEKYRALGISMLKNYYIYDHAVVQDPWEVLSIEKRYYIPVLLEGGPRLTGKPDLVVRIGGDLVGVDHKGLSQKVTQYSVDHDDQVTAYMWILREIYGEIPAYYIYNVLLKKVPIGEVRLSTYTEYFQRVVTTRTQAQLDAFGQKVRAELQDMVEVYDDPERAIPSPGWACTQCSFQRPCRREPHDMGIRVEYVPATPPLRG